MLLDIKKEKQEKCRLDGKKWHESDYVFQNQLGNPYTPERLPRKIQEFIKKYKLEHMTVYGFRHSFATLMMFLLNKTHFHFKPHPFFWSHTCLYQCCKQ